MIDHDAAAELWDRYNRGERNVFTRKLYTMQGQKAFDEIRRKYRGDRDFQADRRSLHRRVRAAARRGLARRPRPDVGALLPHLGDRQGLHHAGARRRTVRLNDRDDSHQRDHGRATRRARFRSYDRGRDDRVRLASPPAPALQSVSSPISRTARSTAFSHFGASSVHLIGSTITYLCWSSSVFCVRLDGTRPMSPSSFWPSGDSTKSANSSAALRMRRVLRQRDRLRAADQRLDRDPVDRPALGLD